MGKTLVVADTLSSREDRQNFRRNVHVSLLPDYPQLIMDSKVFPKIFEDGDPTQFNLQFIEILEDIRRDVEKKGIDLRGEAETDRHFQRLRKIGKAACNKFLSDIARKKIAELEQLEKKRGLSFTFLAPPSQSFFWEMLYAGSPIQVDPEQHWGFRYPIGRLYWGTDIPEKIYLQEGIFTSVHDKLEFSKQEARNIQSFVAKINQVIGPRIRVQLLDEIARGQKWSAEKLVGFFHGDDFRYGLIHFACHCENLGNTGAIKARLSLTACEEALELELEELLIWQEYGFICKPFVFLNACQSATLGHLLETTSFPSEFLNFGAGGVIAAACTIPDNFASAFATEFYRRLFDQATERGSANIGEILLETRLHFLRKYNNPLGLAYGLFAFSHQKLHVDF